MTMEFFNREAPYGAADGSTFMSDLIAALSRHFDGYCDMVSYQTGPKFMKIVRKEACHERGSVYAFLDKDGNIYKAAGWKAPAKGIRGNIFNEPNFSIGRAFEKYSVRYNRG